MRLGEVIKYARCNDWVLCIKLEINRFVHKLFTGVFRKYVFVVVVILRKKACFFFLFVKVYIPM